MLRSMTGFGGASGVIEGVEYSVEIRSVNNRYFRANIKVPEIWAQAEASIEQLLRKGITRGTVTLALRMKVPADQAAYRVNTAALANYVQQLKFVEMEADPTFRIDLAALLQLPGVCEPPDIEELCQKTYAGLVALIEKAIAGLLEMRRREGEALKQNLLEHIQAIDRQLAVVSARAPLVVQDYHQRLAARVKELTNAGNVRLDEDVLAREVAIFAERCDIAEEIARLHGHLAQFRKAFDEPDPSGRKLDFLAQEMLREANTIASKANDGQIAVAAVEIKTAIDRIKEQAANVE